MAVVYEAYQKNLRRRVAVKILPPSSVRDDFKKKTFDREAEAVANLQHPNIVQIYSIGQFEGMSYFVMELVKGKTLEEILQHRRNRPARSQRVMMKEEACRILLPVLDALAYTHEQGIVHRDIKPANIMIDQAGRVFLTDFGVLRLETDDEGTTRVLAGTPAYMAPEQRRGEIVDGRADLYAVGLIFLEMLTATPPREGVDATDLLLAAQQPEEDGGWQVPLEPEVVRFIWRAVRPDPDARFQTAAEMMEAMKALVTPGTLSVPAAAEPVEADATEDEPSTTEEMHTRYRKAMILVAVLAALCGVLGFWLVHLVLKLQR